MPIHKAGKRRTTCYLAMEGIRERLYRYGKDLVTLGHRQFGLGEIFDDIEMIRTEADKVFDFCGDQFKSFESVEALINSEIDSLIKMRDSLY